MRTESQRIVPVNEGEQSDSDMYSFLVIKPMLMYSKVKGLQTSHQRALSFNLVNPIYTWLTEIKIHNKNCVNICLFN